MTLIDQLEDLIEQAHEEGREPILVRIMAEKIAIVEADADARQILGRGTIFGVPYEPYHNLDGQGVTLVYKDSLPE